MNSYKFRHNIAKRFWFHLQQRRELKNGVERKKSADQREISLNRRREKDRAHRQQQRASYQNFYKTCMHGVHAGVKTQCIWQCQEQLEQEMLQFRTSLIIFYILINCMHWNLMFVYTTNSIRHLYILYRLTPKCPAFPGYSISNIIIM